MRTFGRIVAIITTLILALIGGVAGFFGVAIFWSASHDVYFSASRVAVCHTLRMAQAQGLVNTEQRAQWAKQATPAESTSGGKGDSEYYQSDCTLTPLEFAIKRSLQRTKQ